jgi:hypothetical protein
MYKKPKYTKPSSYSTINKYDSYMHENPIQEPQIRVGMPLIFQSVGRVPTVINEIADEQLKQVKYDQRRYGTF